MPKRGHGLQLGPEYDAEERLMAGCVTVFGGTGFIAVA